MILAILGLYLCALLAIGFASRRMASSTGEDFFLAGRGIGSFVLLMTLFGTHMTAFSLLGASGEAYRVGIGVFGLMASASALVAPAVFYFLGVRLWALGKRHGYITQVQFFRDRYGSKSFGLALFVVLVILLIPYLLIGVKGGGITLEQITEGAVPEWAGSLIIVAVVMSYVSFGGLRGTSWANTFQTLVFITLGALAAVVILRSMGGVETALDRVAAQSPELLVRGEAIPPLKMLTYLLIPLSVGMFPHIFQHWLSAQSARTFRLPMVAYPLCIAAVWVPSVLLGVAGTADVPGLEGSAANGVLVRMIGLHAPELLAGLLTAGVFAAIMSSLDSQVLSMSSLFTHDVLRGTFGMDLSPAKQVLSGRLFVVLILAVTYGLSLASDPSLFRLGVWSFTGFASLVPLALAAVYWRRSTLAGAWAALLTVIALWLYFFTQAGDIPGYSVGGTGVMPVAVIFAAAVVALVVVSLMTRPPSEDRLGRFFPESAGLGSSEAHRISRQEGS
ncbi:MAG: sodium:solute symporter family protein [Acidobacteriota bacterium]